MSERQVVTVGVFDGVHRGHRAVIERLLAEGRSRTTAPVAVTFDPHPLATLAPERCPLLLSTLTERERLLRDAGVEQVVVVRFDERVASLTPAEFLDSLKPAVRVGALVVGPDHTLGHEREGTADVLRRLGQERGFAVETVPPVRVGGVPVSSTHIRLLLTEGRLAEAEDLLGHRFTLEGAVVPGDARGRSLGFPTANLAVPREKLLPANGVYAVLVEGAGSAGEYTQGAMNIVVRPTFGDGPRTVEVHLLYFSGDLRGRSLRVILVERLRPELKFASTGELIAQMHRDVERAHTVLTGVLAERERHLL